MAFNRSASNTETCQLLQHPVAPPKKIHSYKRPSGWNLALGYDKVTHTAKADFYLVSFLDAAPGNGSSHSAKTGILNLLRLNASDAGVCQRLWRDLGLPE